LELIVPETFYLPPTTEAFLRDVDLSENPNINSIHLRSLRTRSDGSQMHAGHFFARIVSSEMREVVMEIRGGDVEMLEDMDWDSIATILQQPNFSKLEKFAILGFRARISSGISQVNRARYWMMQRLPPGRARDKLIVRREG
jgi:hypothetical protein